MSNPGEPALDPSNDRGDDVDTEPEAPASDPEPVGRLWTGDQMDQELHWSRRDH